jgi:hypothetical protein
LNLNLFAAVSGIFSGKKKKETTIDESGKSHSVEHSTGHGKMKGAGAGTLSAIGAGTASRKERHRITDETEAIEGTKQEQQKRVMAETDHLGIDGPKK